MSKKNKHWVERSKETPLIVQIETVFKKSSCEVHRADCRSFLDYYIRNGYLTNGMKDRAREIIRINKNLFPKKQPKTVWGVYCLYAITDGSKVKVGFSNNVNKRMKTLQTGTYKPLKAPWKTVCAFTSSEAKTEEKKLHRRLQKLRVSGEWFDMEALLICKRWRVKGLKSKLKKYNEYLEDKQASIDLDMATMREANRYI